MDASSAEGYLYALGHLFDHGIRRSDFSEIVFVPGPGGQQEKAVTAVYTGRYDIGSVRERTLDLAAERIDLSQIRVLANTPYYPGWLYASRKGLDSKVLHAIRNPLLKLDCASPELRYAQLRAQRIPVDSDHHVWLKIQEKHLRICKRIVAYLLRFARTTETDKKTLDPNDLLDQVTSVVEHTFGLQKITIERRFAAELPLIFGDREKLQQVFLNLLTNAYDAIGSDGRITVSTSVGSEKGEVIVAVANTGSGIPPDVMPNVFDPFFTTKPVGKGTGLGLSVTFGIVKEHGTH